MTQTRTYPSTDAMEDENKSNRDSAFWLCQEPGKTVFNEILKLWKIFKSILSNHTAWAFNKQLELE